MAIWLEGASSMKTSQLAYEALRHEVGTRVQFLVAPTLGASVVQRIRVAISRARKKNLQHGKNISEFTICHAIYPYTRQDGKRFDCVVMWREKRRHHVLREILADTIRSQ